MRPQSGFGASQIPLDRIYWYAERVLKYPEEDIEPFVWIMRVLDLKLMELESKKAKNSKP